MIPLDVTPDVQKQIISELEILFQVKIANDFFLNKLQFKIMQCLFSLQVFRHA